MDPRFLPHNMHLENPKKFLEFDVHLRQLQQQPYAYTSPLIKEFPTHTPGIYTVSGGRQIGKTTLLKQWMYYLIADQKISPPSIAFFSGELIPDAVALFDLLKNHLEATPLESLRFILIDEVTYIRDWYKAIKYAADSGFLENVILMLTGSDLVFIKEAMMFFPGRRGKADKVNFHVYPLSFREVVILKHPHLKSENMHAVSPEVLDQLYREFETYLIHGGYLTAINDFARHKRILPATFATYSEWIRGDILRRGKQDSFLKEILMSMLKRYGTQISWNSLSKDVSIEHPKTISEYISLLESMEAVFVQSALLEDKLTAAPKKAKKLWFTDPFIFHALRAWLWPTDDPYQKQILKTLKDPEMVSILVESCIVTHYRRFYPTYYIKAEGEVDIAYIHQNRFWPIEIKWTNQLRVKDLKQIGKYKNGLIWTKSKQHGTILDIPTVPLPLALFEIDEHAAQHSHMA